MMKLFESNGMNICTIDLDVEQEDVDAIDWASVKVGDEILGGVLDHIDPETNAYFTVIAKKGE